MVSFNTNFAPAPASKQPASNVNPSFGNILIKGTEASFDPFMKAFRQKIEQMVNATHRVGLTQVALNGKKGERYSHVQISPMKSSLGSGNNNPNLAAEPNYIQQIESLAQGHDISIERVMPDQAHLKLIV